jgi:hypothetical protein
LGGTWVGPALIELEIKGTIRPDAERVGATVASMSIPQRGFRALVKAAAGLID